MTAEFATLGADKKPTELLIDDKAVSFLPGESVIEAATRQRLEIPHYCWHPRLSVAANCRMCLVEVEKAPKLVPACQTECKPGMVVRTQTERVKVAQRQVHEFLLVNHPIDCPICDQAGECKLQDYYMRYQLTPSRMREPKVFKPKLTRLGPHVVYNAQRCIMCTRCVRFMDEVAHDRQLGVLNRGDHSEIGTFPGQPLDNPYALNTVDVCPVGALTSTVFRFKQRAWNLRRSSSICPGCSKGCNVRVDQRAGQVYRLLPRENQAVNQSWLCDEGRLTYAWANERRLDAPLCRDGEFLQTTTAAAALERAGRRLRAELSSPEAWVFAIGLSTTIEDAYALASFAHSLAPKATCYAFGRADGEADDILRKADKNPNRRGVAAVFASFGIELRSASELGDRLAGGNVRAAVVVGHDMAENGRLAPLLQALPATLQLASTHGPLSQAAEVVLPLFAWVEAEGTWQSGEGRLQRLEPAYRREGAKSVLGWLTLLAGELQSFWEPPAGLSAIQAALSAPGAPFAGLSWADIGPLGLAWPPPAPAGGGSVAGAAVHAES